MKLAWTCLLSLAAVAEAGAQARKQGPTPFEQKIDAAIDRGVRYLKGVDVSGGKKFSAKELVALTLLHAGQSPTDPKVSALLDEMLAEELGHTYRVSLQSMVLEEVDRVAHQRRIWECAQFLVDNMGPNGQWGYGEPTTYSADVPTAGVDPKATPTASRPAGKVIDFGAPGPASKPPVRQRLVVRKQRDGTGHDNSNSQYAALGLRACHDAGILLPKEVVEKAAQWWRGSQAGPLTTEPAKGAAVATGPAAYNPCGWDYGDDGATTRGTGYGSMTAGAVGALAIYDSILGKDWKRDANVQAGLRWLGENFEPGKNPKGKKNLDKWNYYFLYAVERAGMLTGMKQVGPHDWYTEGATWLLASQGPDGSWDDSVVDTCFAILFLRRATRPLEDVASVDRLRSSGRK